MIGEKERIELLEYYVGGKLRNLEHKNSSIGLLMDLGYLRCGITSQMEETIKTASMGLVYLRMRGRDHGAPEVVNGRMLRTTGSSAFGYGNQSRDIHPAFDDRLRLHEQLLHPLQTFV